MNYLSHGYLHIYLAALGVVSVLILEFVAMSKGIDGVALAAAIASITTIISGATGFFIGRKKKQ